MCSGEVEVRDHRNLEQGYQQPSPVIYTSLSCLLPPLWKHGSVPTSNTLLKAFSGVHSDLCPSTVDDKVPGSRRFLESLSQGEMIGPSEVCLMCYPWDLQQDGASDIAVGMCLTLNPSSAFQVNYLHLHPCLTNVPGPVSWQTHCILALIVIVHIHIPCLSFHSVNYFHAEGCTLCSTSSEA